MNVKEKHNSYIKKRFSFWAKFYDLTWIFINFVRKQTVNFTDVKKEDELLDLATGTGELALAYALKVKKVIGLDLSEDMINIAREKNNFKNLIFQTGDVSKLNFNNNEFDITSISFGLHEMPEEIIKQALQEINRVTKNNGQIIIVDFIKGDSLFFKIAFLFLRIFECKYYSDFLKLDLKKMLKNFNMKVKDEKIILGGIAKIYKIINKNEFKN